MPSSPPFRGTPDEPSAIDQALGLVVHLMRGWRVMVTAALLVFFVTVVPGFFRPRWYTAAAGFVPQLPTSSNGAAASLASQFGLSLPTADLTQTPDFYTYLLQSDGFRGKLVDGPYTVGATSQSLIEYFKIREADSARARAFAVQVLADYYTASSDAKTGLVRVQFRSHDAALSVQVAQRALELVNDFNQLVRQTQASAERRFLEDRVAQAQTELRSAEDLLTRFLQTNAGFGNSPTLGAAHARIEREVALRQEVYAQVMQRYEQARIEEVHNTPRISIVESPSRPALPDRRGLLFKGMLALIAGFTLGVFLVVVRASAGQVRATYPAATAALAAEWANIEATTLPWIARIRRRGRRPPTAQP